tara:strand:+ start:3703 stop:4515 length:813 start_codon:yes stop_codon:yes gene_type:complete
MIFDIPSNNRAFNLKVEVESDKPIQLKLKANDPNKPATYYVRRKGKVFGKRTFYMKFPVSPKELEIEIYNPKNGNLPYGDDNTFKIVDVKVEPVKECNVWWNDDTKNFYKFAIQFSENAGILSAGKDKPDIYRSDDGKFTIDYYNVIRDKASQKVLSTPARIGHNTGIIEVSKQAFLNYTVPMRLVILLHEYSHKYLNQKQGNEISYETGADINALYVYLGKGWSEIEAHQSFLYVFKDAKSKGNHKRYLIIRDFIDKFSRGKIENCNVA